MICKAVRDTMWAVDRQRDCASGWQAAWLRERLKGMQRDGVSGWKAAWLHGRLTGNVTAWAVCAWKAIQNPPVLALPHRFSCKPNMAASPLSFHAETYLWHSETAHVVGTASSSLSNHRKKIQYPKRKEKCLAVITWYDTSERVVTCCQYRWYHTIRVKELWRVFGTDDITSHVWKSSDVLLVPMISHDTCERVLTCCQYRYHTTRLKELWCVFGTDDITSHVWKSSDVLLVLMISHHTCESVVTC